MTQSSPGSIGGPGKARPANTPRSHFGLWAKAIVSALILIGSPPLLAAKDTLRIGVTTTGIPFTFVDMSSQKPTGAMVDVARAIAGHIGAQPEFVVTQYSSLIPALQAGKIDLISASMFVTAERSRVVDYSDPVYAFGEAMFVSGQDQKQYQLADLQGEIIGAQIGTTFAEDLRRKGLFEEVRLYDSLVDIMRDVKLGRIKAGFGDLPIIQYQLLQNPALGVRIVDGYQPMSIGKVALAVSKSNPDLLQKVNASIAALKASGELQRIFARYAL